MGVEYFDVSPQGVVMITCRELIDFLMSYLDDELDPAQRREFERHLAVCEPCRRYLASYSETVRLSKAALRHGDDVPPSEVPEDLVKAILAARQPPAQ